MYIKRLTISNDNGVIREIKFHKGLNLIVDNTPSDTRTETGNSVGKTTVLRLVDMCLGKDPKSIYTDPSDPRSADEQIKEFLLNTKAIVELALTRNWEKDDIVIRRDFISGKKAIRTINGTHYKAEDFENALGQELLGINISKPSFRQIISHNIRYSELALTNVLKTVNVYTKDTEYEALYLFMFGCEIDETDRRQELIDKIKAENAFKKRLEKSYNKSTFRTLLGLVDAKIEELEARKASLNVNPDFENLVSQLNKIKCQINVINVDIVTLELKKNTILETRKEIESQHSNVDIEQLSTLYKEAKSLIPEIQRTFEELVSYHNSMIASRSRFISMALPTLNKDIEAKKEELKRLLEKENELSKQVTKSDTYESLEALIAEMNNEYQKKGEYENQIKQIEIVENAIIKAEEDVKRIDDELFSESFQNKVQSAIDDFNVMFSNVSTRLYDEEYVLKVDKVNCRGTGGFIYKFSAFNANLSSGKKMGEISCFDIAYTMYAKKKDIPCLNFLLTDKKELMSDNQLLAIAEIVDQENIQFVASILKDKLPSELQDSKYYIIELSEHDKLFRI
jgi:uncharacterized protein YydD (DUF2326 family)